MNLGDSISSFVQILMTLKAISIGGIKMGWRYRKSINMGKNFRLNLSKSGIGWSTGFKGFRYTKKANGGTRTTNTISGTGVSYVKDSPDKSKNTANNLRTKNNNITSNPKKPNQKWLIAIAIILIIALIFKFNLFNLLAFIGLVYVLYIAVYKFILKKQPPYVLPINKSKYLQTRWIAAITITLFLLGAMNAPTSVKSSKASTESSQTLKDSNDSSDESESIADSKSASTSESIAASESADSEKVAASESTAASQSVVASESAAASQSIVASESAAAAAQSVAASESVVAAAQSAAASESAVAAQNTSIAAANTTTSNNTTGIRWAIEDGYTWETRKGHSHRLSPGESLPAGYHYQTGN